MNHFSDQEILQAIRKGDDTKVIESLYASVLPKVKKHVYSNGGSLDDAYDVFQEAIMVFYKLVISERYDSDKYKVHGFVYTICKNQWINLIKKRISSQNREKNMEKEDLDSTILETMIHKERKTALDQVFQTLGEKCTEVLVLFYYHRLSLREIAQKLGYESENSVKVKSHRCKKLLAEKIQGNTYLMEQLRHWA
jgi:RNA polymerase sigma factor (sigma-70 family)